MAKKTKFQGKFKKEEPVKAEQQMFKKKKKQKNFNQKPTDVAKDFFVKSPSSVHNNDEQPTNPLPVRPQLSDIPEKTVQVQKFGKNKNVEQKVDDAKDSKKPFDKKLFRLKKYSKKYKLDQWEEKRKKTLLREYHKSLKDENEPKLDVAKIYEEEEEEETANTQLHENNEDKLETEGKSKKKKPFLKPHERFQKMKEEKEKKKEEMMQKKAERDKAIKKAKKERFERNKKLSQKTRKGQPIMRYRMEMLLEKIEQSLKE